MDPDDPRTFLNGKFDLTTPTKNTRFDFLFLNRFKNYLNSAKDIKFLIPIFLFLILLLNLLKIFNSNENVQVEILPKDNQEFEKITGKILYVSATPADYEIKNGQIQVEQIIRPTGLLDPVVEVRPVSNQVEDLLVEINARVEKKERVLITTLTKKMSEYLNLLEVN